MVINFQDYGVEHIYCINYIKNNRKKQIEQEFDYIEINYLDNSLFSWEFDYDDNVLNLKENYELEKKKNELCFQKFDYYPYDLKFETFKLSLRNYSIMKKSLDLGYKKIMIFEDDIVFLKNINKIKTILDNLDYSNNLILLAPSAKFSYLLSYKFHNQYKENVYNFYEYYVTNKNLHYFDLYCAGCNIYDEEAMKAYIYIIENICCISPDLYFYYEQYPNTKINICATLYPICFQRSDIDKELENFHRLNKSDYRI